jgi:2-oxoglutarate dehydrogenase E2 component (dihydrolipoamide succinyltransferase)
MPIELRVPEVGESISEVMIGDWLKKVGDLAERDEPVVVIETDKVTVELLAPERGYVSQVVLAKGSPAKVRELVGWMEAASSAKEPGSDAELPPYRATMPTENAIPSTRHPAAADLHGIGLQHGAHPEPQNWASPSARRARAEMQAHGSEPGAAPPAPDAEQLAAVRTTSPAVTSGRGSTGGSRQREEEVVAMSPFRRTIAERLVQSKNTAALLTTFNEVDMSGVQELRRRYQDVFQERHQVKLGFMSFFVKAAVEALKQVPVVNAEIRGTDIIFKNYFDIGIAVGGGRGLVVPVIRNAEFLGLAEIEKSIADFAGRAKDNKLQLDELTGGTFTISNGGVYGSMLSTPIVNPPQSGILGLHSIQDRPVAHEGQVVIRPMMFIALTYDHRIVDGREAVTFLRRIKEFVEQPARILLEV